MTAALIGLAGLIVGSLLGGFLDFASEKRGRREAARAAALLIAAELDAAAQKIRRTERDLATDAWKTGARDLLTVVPNAFDPLLDRYHAIERWDRGEPLEPEEATEFEDVARDLRAIDDLMPGQKLRGFFRTGSLAAAALAAVLLLIAASVPRPDVSDATVADRVERVVGGNVDCDPFHGDWRCTTLEPSAACPHAQSDGAPTSCDLPKYEVSRDGDRLDIVTKSPKAVEAASPVRHTGIEKVSTWMHIVRFFQGKSD